METSQGEDLRTPSLAKTSAGPLAELSTRLNSTDRLEAKVFISLK